MNISDWLESLPTTLHAGWSHGLQAQSAEIDRQRAWPTKSLQLVAAAGGLKGLISELRGGLGWSAQQQLAAYFLLAKSCMTTAFIVTQWHAAIRRLEIHASDAFWGQWGGRLLDGSAWTTVGISHLTTSRQHLHAPPLLATRTASGFRLNGYSPWVTGGAHADFIVIAAVTDSGEQVLAAVETQTPGVEAGIGLDLMALSSSCTDQVSFRDVDVRPEYLLAGPVEQVLKVGSGGPGGLHTSVLALGLASCAIDYLSAQAQQRPDFAQPAEELQIELEKLVGWMLELAVGQSPLSLDQLRHQANSLALRSTQAAMAAAKGAGYVSGHAVGRWCREAMFFLVWSCPQAVVRSQVCELAGIS